MARADTLLAAGQATFGGLDRIALLQAVAERAAAALLLADPEANVEAEAVYQRACENGFACLTKQQLLTVIAEKLFGL